MFFPFLETCILSCFHNSTIYKPTCKEVPCSLNIPAHHIMNGRTADSIALAYMDQKCVLYKANDMVSGQAGGGQHFVVE